MKLLIYYQILRSPYRNQIDKYFPFLLIIIKRNPHKLSMDNQHATNPEDQNNEYGDDFEQMLESNIQKQQNISEVTDKKFEAESQRVELQIQETQSRVMERQQLNGSKQESNVEVRKKKDLKDAQTENKIKETINRLTKNILTSKKQIVQEISTINKYQEQNQKQIKYKEKKGIKYIYNQKISEKSYQLQSMKKKLEQMEKQKILQEMRSKQEEKRRKKQIYLMQKMERMEKQHIKKDRTRMKEQQLEKRIIYEQKFKSRKGLSPEQLDEKIDQEQIKILEEAFIQRIKDRLNIGKSNQKRHKSLNIIPPKNERRKKVMERQQALKKYNKKVNQDNKFKQKILMNLRIRREKEQEEKEKQGQLNTEKKRNYHSAPNIQLPMIGRRMSKRTTLYEKGMKQEQLKSGVIFSQYD